MINELLPDSVGYIYRVRNSQQQKFDLHDARFANGITVEKDWLENNSEDPKYIENRTHYVLSERLELLKPSWFMVDDQGIVTENSENAPTFEEMRDGQGQLTVSRKYKLSDIYATTEEAAAATKTAQFELLLKKCFIYNDSEVQKLKDIYSTLDISYIELNEISDNTKHAYQISVGINKKFIYILAVKDAGSYMLELANTPYWGVRVVEGSREWYRITDPLELEQKTYGEIPAVPTVAPGPEYDVNKYYLETHTVTETFDEGVYSFCEFNNDEINYAQAFVVNSKERVIQIPKKYIQDVWDAIEQSSSSETERIRTLENKVQTIEQTSLPAKMDVINPTGSGTMLMSGKAIFSNGAYSGATAVADNKLITQSELNTAIATINGNLANKLDTNNPAATGNFILATDKVVMNGTTGNIVAAGTVTATNLLIGQNFNLNTYVADTTVQLNAKRDKTDLEFSGAAGYFSGDLYVGGLSSNPAKKKVATVDQLDSTKFLGIYYNDANRVYPTGAQVGDYIYLINEYGTLDANKLRKYTYDGQNWNLDETFGKIFSDSQWTNINTSFATEIQTYASRIATLENTVSELVNRVIELEEQCETMFEPAESLEF